MHEYSVVQSLLQAASDSARQNRALAVHSLSVRIGELSGLDVGLLRTAYDTIRAGTVCAQAELTISVEPASWRCPMCGRDIARGRALRCDSCGVPATLAAGGEMTLERMELEVADA